MIQCPDVRCFVLSRWRAERVEKIGDLGEDSGDDGRGIGELTDFGSDESFCGETGFAVGWIL